MKETCFGAVSEGGYFLSGLKGREKTYIKKTPAWGFCLVDKDWHPFLAGTDVLAMDNNEYEKHKPR